MHHPDSWDDMAFWELSGIQSLFDYLEPGLSAGMGSFCFLRSTRVSQSTKGLIKCLKHLTSSLRGTENVILRLKNNDQLSCVPPYADHLHLRHGGPGVVFSCGDLPWCYQSTTTLLIKWYLASYKYRGIILISWNGMPNAYNFSFGLKKV